MYSQTGEDTTRSGSQPNFAHLMNDPSKWFPQHICTLKDVVRMCKVTLFSFPCFVVLCFLKAQLAIRV